MSWIKLRSVLGTILLSLFTLGLLYFCFQNISWDQWAIALKQVNAPYLLLAFSFGFLVLILLVLQLDSFLKPKLFIPLKELFGLVSVFAMATNLLPFGGAYPLFIYLFAKREKMGIPAALSLLTLDQIMDGLGKLFLFALLLFSISFPVWIHRGIETFVGMITFVYVLVFIFAFSFKEKKEFSRFPKIFQRLFFFVNDWAHHLHTLRSIPKTLWAVFLGLAMKLSEVGGVWAIQKSFGLDLGWPAALLLVCSLCLTTALPSTPAKLGIYEGTALFVYKYLGVEDSLALLLGIFIHLAHTLPLVLAGYVSAIRMKIRRKEALQPIPGSLG